MSEAYEKYIDVADGLSRLGGNESLYRKLLGQFIPSVNIEGFDAAIAAKDFEEAERIVHAVKGTAGNLSLTALFKESSILMDQLRGGGEPQDKDVSLFKQLYEETKQAIDDYIGSAN